MALSAELSIVGNRPEPWDEFVSYMKGHGLELTHDSNGHHTTGRKVLAFHAPIQNKLDEIRGTRDFESVICEGLFSKESWPLLAELLGDIAGQKFVSLGKLLQNPTCAQSVSVTSAKHRHELKDRMVEYLKSNKVRSTIADRCFQVAEEMLMNAIYDAPVDQKGASLYNHLSRKEDVQLQQSQFSKLEYGVKNQIVAVSVTDPFGGLTRDTLVDYLDSCYNGHAGEINEAEGKGGAGRGLHLIVESSDLTVFQVKRGQKTRVISYFWQKENPFGENPQLSFTYFD